MAKFMETLKTSTLRTDELMYELPERLIATRPMEPRDAARMLVMSRSRDDVEHRQVRDLPEYLKPGDALVFNKTKVIPARLIGRKAETGGKVEGLFLKEVQSENGFVQWSVMLKSTGRLKAGQRIELLDHANNPSGVEMELLERDDSYWRVSLTGEMNTESALDRVGWTPLPPYILHARGSQSFDDETDRVWYQTMYADDSKIGSVAAPTAGLHFTPGLLEQLSGIDVGRIDITLHVGPGTFKPITSDSVHEHVVDAEWYEVTQDAIRSLNTVRESGGRSFAVGTTSVRTLESLPSPLPTADLCASCSGMTDLMIAPPYEFKVIDGMLTNFHLPRSSLLALVAAMVGLERIKDVYSEAVERGYRFYSYGDAMLILP